MIKLYGDIKSQPARAVWILAYENEKQIGPWERVEIRMSKLEHYKKEYKRINPIGKVPAMQEMLQKDPATGQWKEHNMAESHAIMKYICASRNLPDHWYPSSNTPENVMKRAKMDQYLDWHHAGIRMGAGAYFFRKFFSGAMDKNGKWASQESIDESWKQIDRSLQMIERLWLRKDRKHKYMFGDKPSIADISLACELTQCVAFDYPFEAKFPEVTKWLFEYMMEVASFKKLHDEAVAKLKHVIGYMIKSGFVKMDEPAKKQAKL